MQLFIGGARAGKRDNVVERFPRAGWHRLAPGEPLAGWRDRMAYGVPLVVTGWRHWLEAVLAGEPDDERLREAGRCALEALGRAEPEIGAEVVLIMDEMGRGIVPMAGEKRRLRDLCGWLAQDAATRCERVWYVRHGLVQRLR